MNKETMINKLSDPTLINELAHYFSLIWGIPVTAYVESMEESLQTKTGVPSWYYITKDNAIIGGVGLILNDFHKRTDLTPNIVALYVDENYRYLGLAKKLLAKVYEDLVANGIHTVYLITTHRELYEKLGYFFVGDIEELDGNLVRCYGKNI